MKLLHVVPHLSEEASGPTYSVPRLCSSLAALGHDVEIACLAARHPIAGVRLDIHHQWPVLSRFAVSPSHAASLRRKASLVDVVHNHGLWSMVNIAAGWVVPGKNAKLVTSPRGTLSIWALSRSRFAKRALWRLQSRVLERADMIHATSDTEHDEIRNAGFRAPVAIIPNGIDLPELAPIRSARLQRTLLFLSRIHPIKGIDRLLQAWRQLQDVHPDWRLCVVGRGEPAHEREVQELIRLLRLERVEFAGPLYGSEKSRAYFESDLFVLPTHSENFGVVVAEALAHGCPAVVSKGAPWSGLHSHGCGWWTGNEVDELATTLNAAMLLPPDRLVAMGYKARAWMGREYGWESIAGKMEQSYRFVLDGGAVPDHVRE